MGLLLKFQIFIIYLDDWDYIYIVTNPKTLNMFFDFFKIKNNNNLSYQGNIIDSSQDGYLEIDPYA